MQFKHPELLYALFLLLIPIIVHLFQLRKFKKIDFTNVAFLKDVTIKTRKSSQIKKWLILCTRLLLLAAIILAFAQPFYSKSNTFKTEKETVIYLDNSFSMQVKGKQGELLKRALQDIINNISESETISIVTNNKTFKNTSIKAIKNDLLQLDYASTALPLDAALLKSESLFKKEKGALKNLIFISDFQQKKSNFNPKPNPSINLNLVKLEPVNKNNLSIDSAYISKNTATTIELKVLLKNSGDDVDNLPVSLYNNNKLIAKTAVNIQDKAETTFSIPSNEIINGKITIEDSNLQFDNSLYFNINNATKINVLSLNTKKSSFLERIYTKNEFNYIALLKNNINYNILNQQHVIILNELEIISNELTQALKQFSLQGGFLIIIPSKNINKASYNNLLANNNIVFNKLIPEKKRVAGINYAHPIYNNGVFEKQINNFQYPKINSFYNVTVNSAASVLKYEDGSPFLLQNKNTYVYTAPLNTINSSFKNSALIVPTFYNMAKQSFKIPELYYTIGKENAFSVNIKLQQDDILSLENDKTNIIPRQKHFNNKVLINTSETPSTASIYNIKTQNKIIKNVSFNYNRSESNLTYQDLSNLKEVTLSNSISKVFNSIKSDTKINALWKWFVIFTLALLIIEMLILKYFK